MIYKTIFAGNYPAKIAIMRQINLDVGEKVDYYDQLHLNWEQFVKYVWSFKRKRGKDI